MQAMALVAELARCVQLSGACAAHFAQTGGPSILLHFMRSCNRSAPHLSMLRCEHSALGLAVKLCRSLSLLLNYNFQVCPAWQYIQASQMHFTVA